jgi:hypothetical protein
MADGSGEAVGAVAGLSEDRGVGVTWGVDVTSGRAVELEDGWGVGLCMMFVVPGERLAPPWAGEGSLPPVRGAAKACAPNDVVSAAASTAVRSGRAHLDVLFIFPPAVFVISREA